MSEARYPQPDREASDAPHQTRHKRRHLGQRVEIEDVVLPRELADVPDQVLGAELVEHALVSPLQRRPE